MEKIITKMFSICFRRLLPFALVATVIAGLLSLLYAMILKLLRKKTFKSSVLRQAGKELNYLTRKGMHYTIVLVALTIFLYAVFFTWSIVARRVVPTEAEYVESLHSITDWEHKPISSKMNLTGATHEEINKIFGEASRIRGNREVYKGTIDGENDYEVILIFLPGLERVFWYTASFKTS